MMMQCRNGILKRVGTVEVDLNDILLYRMFIGIAKQARLQEAISDACDVQKLKQNSL